MNIFAETVFLHSISASFESTLFQENDIAHENLNQFSEFLVNEFSIKTL